MKNFIIRTITGVLFVAAIITCFLRAEAMILLFALVTGLTIWEFAGLVNERECQHKARCHVPGQTLLASQGWSSVMCSRCLLMAFGPLPTSSFAVPWATILLAD